ncbi:MAG: ParB N-terminal domain-containing protein [Desulfovibrio sp.]
MLLSENIYAVNAETIRGTEGFPLWKREADASLQASISKSGQLAPVLVEKRENELYLIAGFRRLQAVLSDESSKNQILVREVSFAHTMDGDEKSEGLKERGLAYLDENFGTALTETMKVEAFRFFQPLGHNGFLRDEVASRLGIPTKGKELKLLLAWMALPVDFDSYLAAGNVPLAAAKLLQGRADEEFAVLRKYFADMQWSRSNAVNFLTWTIETTLRDAKSLTEVLDERFDKVMKSGLSPKDTITRLVRLARDVRMPNLQELEAEAANLCSDLAVKPWAVVVPPNFENSAVELSVRIRSEKELEKAIKAFEEMRESKVWPRFFTLGGRS